MSVKDIQAALSTRSESDSGREYAVSMGIAFRREADRCGLRS